MKVPSANREQNNWPLKDGSGESEGTTLFQTETGYNPTGDSKQQHFPLMETRWNWVTAGPPEPAQARLTTTVTVGSLCSFLKFEFFFKLLSFNSKAINPDHWSILSRCACWRTEEHYSLHMHHFSVFNEMLRFRLVYFQWCKHLTLTSLYLVWAWNRELGTAASLCIQMFPDVNKQQ